MKRRHSNKIASNKKIRMLLQLVIGVLLATSIAIPWDHQRVSAQSGWFVVNDSSDAGDGVCDSTCTLRDAILAANGLPYVNTITFDSAVFAAPGPHTINLSGALPDLNSNMMIQGPGPYILTVRRNSPDQYRIFTISEGQTVTIFGLTVSNGSAMLNSGLLGDGGGILNLGTLTLFHSVVSDNSARFCGGGVCNRGTATVIHSRITDNYSDHSGGGVGNYQGTLAVQNSTVSGNESLFYGGGISNRWTATACNVTDSTVSGNHTGDSGGGIFSEGPLTVTSITVSGNTADVYGGGIADEGTLSVMSATITNNRADVDNNSTGWGGGIFFQYDFPILRNTIVADNYRGATSATDDDILVGAWGDVAPSSSFNLIGTGGSGGLTNGVNGNQVGVEPDILPLQLYGGRTETHPLRATSPAIDSGHSFGLTTDQRGFLRPFDLASVPNVSDGSDIGAHEYGSGATWSIATDVGTDVTVGVWQLAVKFSEVTQAGVTTLTAIDSASAGTLPTGYSLGPGNMPAYEITTTAEYTPPVTICIGVASFTDLATFDSLRILHGEGGVLVDRTILAPDSPAPDFGTKTLCARVDSLSPFVVAEFQGPAPTPSPSPTGDTTAPTISIAAPADGAAYTHGQAVAADYSCQDEPGGSGLASCVGTVANGAAINTATVGSHTFTVTATDNAGNSFAQTHTYNVGYDFTGFFQPLENMPTLNVMSAGSSVPVKFSLGGNEGLSIFAPGYPVSSPVACDASEPGVVIEETVTAGNSSLSYDAATGLYSYVWKTEKSWKGSCRMLVVRLNDNTEHMAKFRFR